MGTLTQEVHKQIAEPALRLVVQAIEEGLDRNTPSMSGNLKANLVFRRAGVYEFQLYGPPYARLVEYGTPAPISDKWTRTHRQRFHGTLRWVTRTYTNYMRPKRIPRLEGTPEGPWRIVQDYGRMGHGFIHRSITEALQQVLSSRQGRLKAVLPQVMEVTSLA